MSCSSCGNKTTVQPAPPNTTNLNMIQFIESKGWKYSSNCGCSNNMNNYVNDAYPDKMISCNGLRMEIKRNLAAYSKDYKVVAVAGNVNFEHIYNLFITQT